MHSTYCTQSFDYRYVHVGLIMHECHRSLQTFSICNIFYKDPATQTNCSHLLKCDAFVVHIHLFLTKDFTVHR